LAGRLVRLACARHLRDLKDGAARGLRFDLHAAGLLTTLDLRLLEGYCVQYARWCQAEDEIRKSGTVIKGYRNAPVISPYVRVARDAFVLWTRALVEFGMTPSSRSRVSVTKPEKPDAFQLFLERGRLPTREELE